MDELNAFHLLNNRGLADLLQILYNIGSLNKSFCKVLNCTILFQRALLLGRMRKKKLALNAIVLNDNLPSGGDCKKLQNLASSFCIYWHQVKET